MSRFTHTHTHALAIESLSDRISLISHHHHLHDAQTHMMATKWNGTKQPVT
jgi:hypothetical protein